MTGLIELHQGERHHEANGGPLETSKGQFKHFRQTLAARTAALKKRLLCLLPGEETFAAHPTTNLFLPG
jgi:hypothetical protein